MCGLVAVVLIGCEKKEEAKWGPKNANVADSIQGLKSPDKNVRMDAAIALASLGPAAADAVSALTASIKDSDPEVRKLVAYALGQIGPKSAPAIAPLKELLNDADRNVVTAALNALRAIDPKSVGDLQIKNVTTP